MREAPRAPFDQGLFLTHFNKGKAFYDEKRFEEAERELEEAYLLRPRDQKVLNLLGLVYFKQDKYDKAEEIYRKLVAESPEAHTLFYNLGLIYFKLARLEEAETAFLKALDLAKDNPKINFYLGSIYERLHRFQDAIYQYRQAGANLMVRRVEDKLATAGPRPAAPGASDTAPPARAPGSTKTVPPTKKGPHDTAEFKAQEIRDGLRKLESARQAPADRLQPVSDVLMADEAPPRVKQPGDPDTNRFKLPEGTIPPRAGAQVPEIITFPKAPLALDRTIPPRRTESFRVLENNLMESDFSGKVFIKQGTIYSYSGNLTFWVKERRPAGQAALVIVTGTGRLILTDKDREITFMHVQDETAFIEPAHLLACEETLTPRYVPVAGDGGLEVLALDGRGMVALSVATKPLALPVTPEMPVSIPAVSVITWSGGLTPKMVDDSQLYEVMLPGASKPGAVLRLEGTGRVLVEQAR